MSERAQHNSLSSTVLSTAFSSITLSLNKANKKMKPRNLTGEIRRPLGPTDEQKISKASQYEKLDHERVSTSNPENVLEEIDLKYDAMLSQMVGRISVKPCGKLEMGEALVVENPNRPLPKLRNTTPESGRYEERPAPPGTLNIKLLRDIMLLNQGKADDHNGPMDVQQIAEKFRLDVVQVQRILQFMSLAPEDSSKQKKH